MFTLLYQQEQTEFHLNFDELDEASTYMPSPFRSTGLPQPLDVSAAAESDAASPANSLQGQIAIPTPPPEGSPDSTQSSLSHGSCISAQFSASATSHSYIKGSSLEESPVSSPSNSCAELDNEDDSVQSNGAANGQEVARRESCIRSTMDEVSASNLSDDIVPHPTTNVPKNIKLPQRKFYSLFVSG